MTELAHIAGVDEAGRGPLAGPVVVASVILDPKHCIDGLADSKKLSPNRRNLLFGEIQAKALAFSIVSVSAAEIDALNILQATLQGMARAVGELDIKPALVKVDGNQKPPIDLPCVTLIGGDALEPAISAASILAKVYRDEYMEALHERFPMYGFKQHKGYPTKSHIEALRAYGPCPEHRHSFKPVSIAIEDQQSF
jgi:ribonuclease HII